MSVFRVERTKGFTVMSNYHLNDKRISLKAKGLLSQMLSLPDNWDFTLRGLAYINKESLDAIRTAVLELEEQATSPAASCAAKAGNLPKLSTPSLSGPRKQPRLHRVWKIPTRRPSRVWISRVWKTRIRITRIRKNRVRKTQRK